MRGLAIQTDVNRQVALMSKTLFSRPNMEKLMRMTDLDLQVTNDLEKEAMLNQLRSSLRLSSGGRGSSDIYSISFKHQDRDMAKKVVQSVITVIVENTLGDKRKDRVGAAQFIDEKIADYASRMAEAEARLAAFKHQHVGAMPGQTGGYYQSLSTAKTQLREAQLQLNEISNRRREMQRQLEDLEEDDDEFGFGEFDSPAISSSYDSRILSLESKRDELLMRYTDRHPSVMQTTSLIAELKLDKQEELDELVEQAEEEDMPSMGLQTSPVYQQMRAMLSETEARAAELKARVGEYKNRVTSLEERVDSIPKVEAEFKELNRDYGVVSRQHTTLLQRRESARLSGDVAQNASGVKFRVIDPPFVPLEPTEPDKLLLHSGAFIVAIGAGGSLALLFSLLRPVICNRRSLERLAGLPVLGSVSMIASAGEKKKALHEKLLFASMVLFLFLTFAGVNLGQSLLST
ncbi:hypothetical protein A9Q89_09505 [Gammaproteobacteria bacterium 53_120_T64]|nr:hypothetical protein A9Q89_09505 [Gammaproteobacteria bacterium 53_120_T64]